MKFFNQLALSLFVAMLTNVGIAQQLDLQVKDVHEGSYPEYFGTLVVRDPGGIDVNNLVITEGDTTIDLNFQKGVPSANLYSGKQVLLLVLNHQGYDNRTKWYQEVIKTAVDNGLIQPGDSYAIQSFDCNRPEYNSEDKQLLFPAKPSFVSSETELLNQVDAIDLERPKFKTNCIRNSNIYGAVNKALEAFGKSSSGKGKARSIIVFADDWSISQEIKSEGIIQRSKELDIPVYGITYWQNIKRDHGIEAICSGTYGLYYLDKENDVSYASDQLKTFCDGMAQRASGMSYQFSFKTPFGKDGKSHEIQIAHNKNTTSFKYTTPEQTFGEWIQDNMLLSIGIVAGFLILIIVLILNRRKKKKEVEQKEKEHEEEMKRVEEQQKAADLKASQQEEEIRRMKDAELRKEREAREEKRRQELEAENEEKLKQMMSRGNLPWFTFNFQGQSGSFEVNHSEFTLGRDDNNHYRINLPIVSRQHFQLVFSEGTYVITDLKSSNGTFVNGERITSCELKHGDVVSIGDINLTFHI